eukprot:3620433-Prymnesium_polylepis.1
MPCRPHGPLSLRGCLNASLNVTARLPPTTLAVPFGEALAGASSVQQRQVVFLHQQKAGGTTMRLLLSRVASGRNLSMSSCDGWHWRVWLECEVPQKRVWSWDDQGRMIYHPVPPPAAMMIVGDSALGAPLVERQCSTSACLYVTMFREPTSRLVSSYIYCRRPSIPNDVLCHLAGCSPRTATIEDWAEHWGRFALLQAWLPQYRPLKRPPTAAQPSTPAGRNRFPTASTPLPSSLLRPVRAAVALRCRRERV